VHPKVPSGDCFKRRKSKDSIYQDFFAFLLTDITIEKIAPRLLGLKPINKIYLI